MELWLQYRIEDIVFNQSQCAKSSLNQSECLDTPQSLHGTVTARYEPYRNYFPLVRKRATLIVGVVKIEYVTCDQKLSLKFKEPRGEFRF